MKVCLGAVPLEDDVFVRGVKHKHVAVVQRVSCALDLLCANGPSALQVEQTRNLQLSYLTDSKRKKPCQLPLKSVYVLTSSEALLKPLATPP